MNRNEPMDDKLNPAAWITADPLLLAAEAEWWVELARTAEVDPDDVWLDPGTDETVLDLTPLPR